MPGETLHSFCVRNSPFNAPVASRPDRPLSWLRAGLLDVSSEREDIELDLSVIEDLAGGDEKLLAELIGMFIRNTAAAIEKMRAVVATGQFREAALIAHTALGFTATVGIQALIEPLRGLERAAQAADAAKAQRLSAQWEWKFERIRKRLKARLLPAC